MRGLRLRTAVSVAVLCLGSCHRAWAEAADGLRVATFRCDITPPLGQPMFSCDALRTVEQPLLAKGIVLEAGGQRYVLCALDWCELCNGSYEALRNKIAAAAGTTPAHVAVQTVHQHTAPLVDMDAQKLLAEVGVAMACTSIRRSSTTIERASGRGGEAVAGQVRTVRSDRHGPGQGRPRGVQPPARGRDGQDSRPLSSSGKDPAVRALPEGTIDPYLKTITLARGEKPLVRLHYYATHPQTRYGDGRATSDFVGDRPRRSSNARRACSRSTSPAAAATSRWASTTTARESAARSWPSGCWPAWRRPLPPPSWFRPARSAGGPTRCCCPPRTDPGFSLADCLARMKDPKAAPVMRLYAGRDARGLPPAKPAADRVEFPGDRQRPYRAPAGRADVASNCSRRASSRATFVAVAGYGDCGPGYLCPAAGVSRRRLRADRTRT